MFLFIVLKFHLFHKKHISIRNFCVISVCIFICLSFLFVFHSIAMKLSETIPVIQNIFPYKFQADRGRGSYFKGSLLAQELPGGLLTLSDDYYITSQDLFLMNVWDRSLF